MSVGGEGFGSSSGSAMQDGARIAFGLDGYVPALLHELHGPPANTRLDVGALGKLAACAGAGPPLTSAHHLQRGESPHASRHAARHMLCSPAQMPQAMHQRPPNAAMELGTTMRESAWRRVRRPSAACSTVERAGLAWLRRVHVTQTKPDSLASSECSRRARNALRWAPRRDWLVVEVPVLQRRVHHDIVHAERVVR